MFLESFLRLSFEYIKPSPSFALLDLAGASHGGTAAKHGKNAGKTRRRVARYQVG